MKVPDVRRNLVPDTWTADGEGALPVNWVRVLVTTAALVVEERSGRRLDSSVLNLTTISNARGAVRCQRGRYLRAGSRCLDDKSLDGKYGHRPASPLHRETHQSIHVISGVPSAHGNSSSSTKTNPSVVRMIQAR